MIRLKVDKGDFEVLEIRSTGLAEIIAETSTIVYAIYKGVKDAAGDDAAEKFKEYFVNDAEKTFMEPEELEAAMEEDGIAMEKIEKILGGLEELAKLMDCIRSKDEDKHFEA